MSRRYVPADHMHPPGQCLECDGIYRRRVGWPQRPAVLNDWELRNLGRAGEDQRRRPGEQNLGHP